MKAGMPSSRGTEHWSWNHRENTNYAYHHFILPKAQESHTKRAEERMIVISVEIFMVCACWDPRREGKVRAAASPF